MPADPPPGHHHADPRATRLAGLARSLSEHLIATEAVPARTGAGRHTYDDAPDRGAVVVHPHCQGRAAVGTAPDELVLRGLGHRPTTLDGGCCGLAGSYGFAASTSPVAEKIARDHWLPKLHEALDDAQQSEGDRPVAVAMDGFSCITQLRQLDGLPHRTIAGLIADALQDSAR